MDNIKKISNDVKLKELSKLLSISINGFVVCAYDQESTYEEIFTRLKGVLIKKNTIFKEISEKQTMSMLEKSMRIYSKNNYQNNNKIIFSRKWNKFDLSRSESYNTRRDFYKQNVSVTMVIWISKNDLGSLIKQQPDFWRIRLGTFSFLTENELPTNLKYGDVPGKCQKLLEGFVTLKNYYVAINNEKKELEYENKIHELNDVTYVKSNMSDVKIIEELNDLACNLIKTGFNKKGTELHDLVYYACHEKAGSSREEIKKEYKKKMKKFYRKMSDAYFEGGDYFEAQDMYQKIMDNTNSVIDMKLRKETSKKLNKLKTMLNNI